MIELIIDNKDGNMWDISKIVTNITWKTSRIGKPGKLTFTLIKNGFYQNKGFRYSNGDVVRFRKDDRNIFYGYIFSIEFGKDENVQICCYDQMRYLMSNETYDFKYATATEVLQKIAKDFNLKIGTVDDTKYKIPKMLEDGKKLIDTICKALDLTLINSSKNFFLFDDFGELSLRNSEDFLLDFVIGDNSLMYDYNSKVSIDEDTYNKIKLYKDNKKSGKREVYQAQDSKSMAKWGTLQLYQNVDKDMNSVQINELLNTYISAKNRESKSLKIEAVGEIKVRAGCYVPIIIKEFGICQPFIVDECTHKFDGADHTMSLELKVI